MTQSDTSTLSNQDLIDGFVGLILLVQPNADIKKIQKNVQEKIVGLMAHEPFFLRAVLQSDKLSAADKLGKYIGVHSDSDGGERYPEKYHQELKRQTSMLLEETA